ncbi:MAG: hypothetical protein Q7S22_06400 [Candidatus Micrarchaeota archaeon]|nr:hypothetical protein [Candidatus Micrarchaeota archaeon]
MKKYVILFSIFLLFGCLNQTDDTNQTTEKIVSASVQKTVKEISNSITDLKNESLIINASESIKNNDQCEKPVFTKYFVDPKYIMQVGQIGTLHGSGQFTVGRSYISIKDEFKLQKIPIYTPTDMVLTTGAYYQVSAPGGQYLGEPLPDYALNFDAGCGVEILLGHLKETVPDISRQFSVPKSDSRTEELTRIKFKAGDLVGYFVPGAGVAAFDFMIHDASVVNQFANNARQEYGQSDNLIHIACPYDFYTGEMKDAYYNLIGSVPGVENKQCGPASRDYPGTISGLWFLDKEVKKLMYDYSQEGNYGSLLAVVGDSDRVLIGTIGNRRSTFIYPNEPTYKDPKDVTDQHCYQLHPYNSPSQSEGYIFFKLVDEKTMKVFYGETGQCPDVFPVTGWMTYYR